MRGPAVAAHAQLLLPDLHAEGLVGNSHARAAAAPQPPRRARESPLRQPLALAVRVFDLFRREFSVPDPWTGEMFTANQVDAARHPTAYEQLLPIRGHPRSCHPSSRPQLFA